MNVNLGKNISPLIRSFTYDFAEKQINDFVAISDIISRSVWSGTYDKTFHAYIPVKRLLKRG